MILGLGLDVVELDRIRQGMERHGERFLRRILTDAEIEAMPSNAVPYVAARFAAKEAASKALGTGFRQGVTLHCFEVSAQPSGKPEIRFTGPALELATTLGVSAYHISLTHGRDIASAVVILEG